MASRPYADPQSSLSAGGTMVATTAAPALIDEVIQVMAPMTPEQERQYHEALDQHMGEWVAVEIAADGAATIVAAAASIAELRKLVGPRSDAMLFEVQDLSAGVILGVA